MGSPQLSIESVVGPPITVIPFLAYPDGTYNPTTTATSGADAPGTVTDMNAAGAIARVRDYRGAIMQIVVSRPLGANENAIVVIPKHGPCNDIDAHDPFGSGWGVYVNGKSNASPGVSKLVNVFIDTEKCSSCLSAEITINTGSVGLVGVTVIPLMPKDSPRIDDFTASELLTVFGSGPLNLVGP